MALLTADELLDIIDSRRIGDQVLDDNMRATVADMTNATTVAGRRVAVAIAGAEGEFYSAVTVGARYTIFDIEAMVNNIDAAIRNCGSSNLIRQIVANLAYGILLKRRTLPASDFEAAAPGYFEAQQKLVMLRNAERIFPDIAGVPEAGLPGTASSIPDVNSLSPPLMSQIAIPLFGFVNQPAAYWGGGYRYPWGWR